MKLEVFEDRMYYDQFAIRPEGSRDFHDTIHFVRKVDALVAMRTIEKWIDQEREACAKICDDWPVGRDDVHSIGQAIRARVER